VSLIDLKKFEDLSAAIDKETHTNYDVIMDLLGLAYDERSVSLIKENLDTGTKKEQVMPLSLWIYLLMRNLNVIYSLYLKIITLPKNCVVYRKNTRFSN